MQHQFKIHKKIYEFEEIRGKQHVELTKALQAHKQFMQNINDNQ